MIHNEPQRLSQSLPIFGPRDSQRNFLPGDLIDDDYSVYTSTDSRAERNPNPDPRQSLSCFSLDDDEKVLFSYPHPLRFGEILQEPQQERTLFTERTPFTERPRRLSKKRLCILVSSSACCITTATTAILCSLGHCSHKASPQPLAPAPQPFVPVPQPLAPAPQPLAPVPQPLAPVPQPLAPAPQPLAPVPQPLAPAPQPLAPVPQPLAPVPQPLPSENCDPKLPILCHQTIPTGIFKNVGILCPPVTTFVNPAICTADPSLARIIGGRTFHLNGQTCFLGDTQPIQTILELQILTQSVCFPILSQPNLSPVTQLNLSPMPALREYSTNQDPTNTTELIKAIFVISITIITTSICIFALSSKKIRRIINSLLC